MRFKIITVLFGLLNVAISQSVLPWKFGRCLNPDVVKNFNATKFFRGRWYEQKSFGNYLFQGNGICPTLVSDITDNGIINIKTYNYNTGGMRYISIDGSSRVSDIQEDVGYLPVTFYGLGGLLPVKIPIMIVGTDYDNWAVVYSCKSRFLLGKAEMSFVLTRNRLDVSEKVKQEIINSIFFAGINQNDYIDSVNVGCGPNEPNI